MKIGVFDSGLGGLTIFKELEKSLPEYDYIYLGDNLRTPYGGRDQETVYEFTKQACDFLFSKDCQIIILACNTASASALRRLQEEYLPSLDDKNKRILGIIRPIAEKIPSLTKNKRIGVIGTKNTISSKAYDLEIAEQFILQDMKVDYKLYKQAAPLFVPLVEENWLSHRATTIIARQYLRKFKTFHIDTLILACTHYPLLIDIIKKIMPKKCNIVFPGPIVAASFKEYLGRHLEIETLLEKNKSRKFLTTGNIEDFNELSSMFLGYSVDSEKVII